MSYTDKILEPYRAMVREANQLYPFIYIYEDSRKRWTDLQHMIDKERQDLINAGFLDDNGEEWKDE